MYLLKKLIIYLLLGYCTTWTYAATNNSKLNNCSSCHGLAGAGIITSYPKLAGQNVNYFINQMLAFKNGQRENKLMQSIAKMLSEDEIRKLADFYARQAVNSGMAKRSSVERGQLLYRAGNKARAIPACMMCHGPSGEGNELAGIPALAGQYAAYTQVQLFAYQTNTRTDVRHIMSDIAFRLSDEDITTLASYIEGLHKNN